MLYFKQSDERGFWINPEAIQCICEKLNPRVNLREAEVWFNHALSINLDHKEYAELRRVLKEAAKGSEQP